MTDYPERAELRKGAETVTETCGRCESADEIRASIAARLNSADPDIRVTTENVNRAKGNPYRL